MKNLEYYINQNRGSCQTTLKRELPLYPSNYLSEFSTESLKQSVRDNLGITEKLNILLSLINNKIILFGGIPWDLEPVLGHSDYILSSDSLYKLLLKYYSKEEINDKIQLLWNKIIEYYKVNNIIIDDSLSESSENPVLNKVIFNALLNYQSSLETEISNLIQLNNEELYLFIQQKDENIIFNLNLSIELSNLELHERINQSENDIYQRINNIEKNLINHIFLTQEQYDNLTSYNKRTLYLILEEPVEEEVGTVFGDRLPLRLGGWVFGGEFPITLS